MTYRDFVSALKGEEHERVPVWFMRQAGRYLPEFRAIRGDMGIKEICLDPERVAEITTTPVKKFGFDAAIIFHDLVLPMEAMGFEFDYQRGIGPVSSMALLSAMKKGKFVAYESSSDRYPIEKSISLFRNKNKDTPLIGFAGGPLTLMSYIVQSRHDGDLNLTREFIARHPAETRKTLDMLKEMIIEFTRAQVKAGVVAIQIFDSWVGNLPRSFFTEFYEIHLREIASELKGLAPIIYFSSGSSHLDDLLQDAGFDFLSVDWRHDLPSYSREVKPETGLQGNLDPVMTCIEPEIAIRETERILSSLAGRSNYIFNLGHGIPPHARIDTVGRLVEAVHAFPG